MEHVSVAYLLLGVACIGVSFVCLHFGIEGWRKPDQTPVLRSVTVTEYVLLVVMSLMTGLEFVAVAVAMI